MTIVKTKELYQNQQIASLANSLNEKDAILRKSWNFRNLENWPSRMETTRTIYHHDKAVRGDKTALAYYQVISFNPDDCDLNGGCLCPDDCLAWVYAWIEQFYPNQEVFILVCTETAPRTGIERYVVHLVINRSDLLTGLRYHTGSSKTIGYGRRIARMELDKRFGLSELVRGQRNSKTLPQQPSRTEEDLIARGEKPWEEDLREIINETLSSPEVLTFKDFRDALLQKGIETSFSKNGKELMYKLEDHYTIRGFKLGEGFETETIMKRYHE